MKNVKAFVKGVYQINKNDYWIVCFLNLTFSAIFNFFTVNELIQGFVIFLLFLKTASFVRSANIMPSISSDFDRFSWKYFQGIPLNKKEIVFSLILVDMFVMSSLLIWGEAFLFQLSSLFFEKEKYDFWLAIQCVVFFFPVSVFISSLSISNQITYPRRQYSKNDPKIVFYNVVKYSLIWIVCIGYGSIILGLIVSELNLSIPTFILNFSRIISKNLTSWWALFPACAFALYQVNWIFKVWQNDKKGYVKYFWNPKLDLSIVTVCFALIVLPVSFADFSTPFIYEGTFQKSVFNKDMKAIQKFAESKANIDKKNDYGLTPIHVAVLTKNDPAYILLVEKGADLAMPVEGKFASRYKGKDIMRLAIESSNLFVMEHLLKNKYHPEKVVSKNLDTPLHVAAVKCNAAMIDKLISYGANVNAVASNGYTALHIAAKTRCFSAVTALIEAGADPKIKDQKGKLAMDIIEKDRAQELSYYLEKKTRAPASVRR